MSFRVGLLSAALLSAAVMIVLVALNPPHSLESVWPCRCDGLAYVTVAYGQRAEAPWTWRVLQPLIVRALPIRMDVGFALTTYLWLWSCGVMAYLVLCDYVTPVWALFGSLLMYSLYWFVTTLLWDIYTVDSLAMLLMLVGIYAALKRKASLFLWTVTFGVLAKESVLFVVPLWYTLGDVRSRRALLHCAALGIPGALLHMLLRLALPAQASYQLSVVLPLVAVLRFTVPVSPLEYFPFGVLPLLALFSPHLCEVFRRYAPLIVLAYVQLIFASDTGRLLIIAYVPFLIAAVQGAERLSAALFSGARERRSNT